MQTVRSELQEQESRMMQNVRNELRAHEHVDAEHTRRLESQMAAMNEDMTSRMDTLLEYLIRLERQTPGSQSAFRRTK